MLRQIWKMIEEVVGEFAPDELTQEGAAVDLDTGRRLPHEHSMPNLARADLPEMEMRRQPRRAVHIGPVTFLLISGKGGVKKSG
jgi:hypothetical protein